MKLATYAHCNTSLRCEARTRAVQAAAGGWAIPTTALQPPCGSGGSGGFGRPRRGSRTLLQPWAGLATAATHTPGAAGGAFGSSDLAALRSSATEPTPFMTAGPQLSRMSSFARRQAAAGITNPVVYPGNLTARELAYFLAAPTLTYQLNFPRLRQRRWRLLSRWLLLAVLTAIAMSFMQVGVGQRLGVHLVAVLLPVLAVAVWWGLMPPRAAAAAPHVAGSGFWGTACWTAHESYRSTCKVQ